MTSKAFPVDPAAATHLTDARLQAHHAVQLAVAVGISYLAPQPDDSHTNLEWLREPGALASRTVASAKPFRVAVRIADLSLHVLDGDNITVATLPLSGETIASADKWLATEIAARGADLARFTRDKAYTIPAHVVESGAPFNVADSGAFDQLSRWFAGANDILNVVRDEKKGSEVRCWPHHFDIATLLDVGPGQTIGIGLEPGDGYYDEPYYYANIHPVPAVKPTKELAGKGSWHTREWFGAVLPGSRVGAHSGQREQIRSFIASAVAAYMSVLHAA